jgi:hypothetical protein
LLTPISPPRNSSLECHIDQSLTIDIASIYGHKTPHQYLYLN